MDLDHRLLLSYFLDCNQQILQRTSKINKIELQDQGYVRSGRSNQNAVNSREIEIFVIKSNDFRFMSCKKAEKDMRAL